MENKKLIQRKQDGGALDQDRINALADAIKDKPQDDALDLILSWNEDGWISDIEYKYLINNVVNKNKTTNILPKVVVEYDPNKGLYQDNGDRNRYIPNNNPRPPFADALFSTAGFLGRGLQFVPHKGVQTVGNLLSLADIGYDMYKVSKNNTLNNKDTEDLVSDVTLGSNYKPPISKTGSKIGKLRLLYYLTNANAIYHDFAGMTNTDVIYSPYKKNTSYTGVYR